MLIICSLETQPGQLIDKLHMRTIEGVVRLINMVLMAGIALCAHSWHVCNLSEVNVAPFHDIQL